jgi:hypothetical protein
LSYQIYKLEINPNYKAVLWLIYMFEGQRAGGFYFGIIAGVF